MGVGGKLIYRILMCVRFGFIGSIVRQYLLVKYGPVLAEGSNPVNFSLFIPRSYFISAAVSGDIIASISTKTGVMLLWAAHVLVF